MCFSPNFGFQSFLRAFTQISPLEETFGWKILVRKYPFGGAAGKSLPSTSFILNSPPEYGVPSV